MATPQKQSICERLGAERKIPTQGSKIGIALETLQLTPIHGLRIDPELGTNGWYFWCGGEMSTDDKFYSPLHVEHIDKYLPEVQDYLELPPGYRFVIDRNGCEDVWFDENLLKEDV